MPLDCVGKKLFVLTRTFNYNFIRERGFPLEWIQILENEILVREKRAALDCSFYCNDFIISSWLLPLVSGKNIQIITAPTEHIAVYRNIAPWKVMALVNSGRNLILMNAKIHISIMQNVTLASFTLSGVISVIVTKVIAWTPNDVTNMHHENVNNGIQLKADTSKHHTVFSIM